MIFRLFLFFVVLFLSFDFSFVYSIEKESMLLKAEETVNAMSLDEKLNQMIMVPVHYALKFPHKNFGGVLYLGWHLEKYHTFEQVKIINERLQAQKIPPLIAIDQEGGTIDRISYLKDYLRHQPAIVSDFISTYFSYQPPKMPSQMAIGTVYQTLQYKEKQQFIRNYILYVRGIASLLSKAGFNTNLAPVLDYPVNNLKSVLYKQKRCFSANKDVVAALSSFYIHSFSSYFNTKHGMLCTAKHFPGLGDATKDSHHHMIDIDESLDNQLSIYKSIIDDVPILMLSHARYDGLDSVYPSTLSLRIREYLIKTWQFDGIILSDDLLMNSLSEYEQKFDQNRFDLAPLANDMLMVSNDFRQIDKSKTQDIIAMVKVGIQKSLTVKQINQRVIRILYNKYRYLRIN